MRPADMDVIARVIAQQVKKVAEDQFSSPQKDVLDENKSLRETVDKLQDNLKTLEKSMAELSDTFVELLDNGLEGVKKDVTNIHGYLETFVPMDTHVADLSKVRDDLAKELKNIPKLLDKRDEALADLGKKDEALVKRMDTTDKALSNVSKFVSSALTKADVSKILEEEWDDNYKNVVAAMIPDEVDLEKTVETVHNLIMKELPNMVEGAMPQLEFPLDDAKKWTAAIVHKWFDENMDKLRGEDGEDGADAEIDMDLVVEQVQKATENWITKNVDQLRGPKGDDGEPAKPLAPTDLQVIEAVKQMYPSIRQELQKYLPRIEHKGTHQPGETYEPGDEVIKGDSTYRAKYETSETPPHADWQCIAKSKIGRKGPTGDKGDKGETGVGIDDMVYDGEQVVVAMTNGDTRIFDLNLSDAIAEAVKQFMFDVKGEND